MRYFLPLILLPLAIVFAAAAHGHFGGFAILAVATGIGYVTTATRSPRP